MAKEEKVSEVTDKEQITFKCLPELKGALEDLARLSRQSVSSLLVDVATLLVKANAKRIADYRKSAEGSIVMPLFAPSEGGGSDDENETA